MTEITAINHLAFITEDLTKTIRFYRDLLGMELNSGIGHDGYRHYFFRFGDNMIAFFEYEGAVTMEKKHHGVKSTKPLGFDHLSFTIESREGLFALKDKLEAAGLKVTGAVDHGFIWSIYFFDNNNIPLEVSWQIMDILETPAITDDDPLAIADEGSAPQPGIWPEPTQHTPTAEMWAHGGNALPMREDLLNRGIGRLRPDYAAALEERQDAAE